MRHDVGIGDQHAGRIGMGAKNADRLARLDQQRFVGFQHPQRRDDPVVALPVARRPGRCRHRPPAPAVSRRPGHPDCSSACASVLRSASSCSSTRRRAAHGSRACCRGGCSRSGRSVTAYAPVEGIAADRHRGRSGSPGRSGRPDGSARRVRRPVRRTRCAGATAGRAVAGRCQAILVPSGRAARPRADVRPRLKGAARIRNSFGVCRVRSIPR